MTTGEEFTCNAGDLGSTPGLGRSSGKGKGYPLQYSGLENSIGYKVQGVAKSRTQLSDFHFQFAITQKPHTYTYFVLLYSYAAIFQVGPSEDLRKYWPKVNK